MKQTHKIYYVRNVSGLQKGNKDDYYHIDFLDIETKEYSYTTVCPSHKNWKYWHAVVSNGNDINTGCLVKGLRYRNEQDRMLNGDPVKNDWGVEFHNRKDIEDHI